MLKNEIKARPDDAGVTRNSFVRVLVARAPTPMVRSSTRPNPPANSSSHRPRTRFLPVSSSAAHRAACSKPALSLKRGALVTTTGSPAATNCATRARISSSPRRPWRQGGNAEVGSADVSSKAKGEARGGEGGGEGIGDQSKPIPKRGVPDALLTRNRPHPALLSREREWKGILPPLPVLR